MITDNISHLLNIIFSIDFPNADEIRQQLKSSIIRLTNKVNESMTYKVYVLSNYPKVDSDFNKIEFNLDLRNEKIGLVLILLNGFINEIRTTGITINNGTIPYDKCLITICALGETIIREFEKPSSYIFFEDPYASYDEEKSLERLENIDIYKCDFFCEILDEILLQENVPKAVLVQQIENAIVNCSYNDYVRFYNFYVDTSKQPLNASFSISFDFCLKSGQMLSVVVLTYNGYINEIQVYTPDISVIKY